MKNKSKSLIKVDVVAALAHCGFGENPLLYPRVEDECRLEGLARELILKQGGYVNDVTQCEALLLEFVFGLHMEWDHQNCARWMGTWISPRPDLLLMARRATAICDLLRHADPRSGLVVGFRQAYRLLHEYEEVVRERNYRPFESGPNSCT